MVLEEYQRHAKVFSEEESHRLPKSQPWDHTIDLKEGAPETLKSKVYPMPINKQSELDRFIKENLDKALFSCTRFLKIARAWELMSSGTPKRTSPWNHARELACNALEARCWVSVTPKGALCRVYCRVHANFEVAHRACFWVEYLRISTVLL